MAESILSDNMEKAPTESNLSITSNDINIELSKEFLVELRKNIYHGAYNEDVVDHIAKVLKMVDLIYVPGMDSHQLRMKREKFTSCTDKTKIQENRQKTAKHGHEERKSTKEAGD
ncbi:hypothetical protein Tco_0144322 [Tanacetum coccineum]